MTGGEPTLYPEFVDLCEHLTQNHYVSVNTNLSNDSMRQFAQRINPGRVNFVHAALHIQERKTKKSISAFIERVHELKKKTFTVLVSQMMTQDAIQKFTEISRYFENHGLILIPKVLRCVRKGKRFPLAYTSEQKLLINDYLEEAEKKYLKVLNNMKESPTILFSDFRFIDNLPDFRGRLCNAGRKFVRIAPNGTVFRCNTSEVQGNILFRDVQFFNAPEPCNTSYSPYWCFKYLVGDEEQGSTVLHDKQERNNERVYQRLRGMLATVSYMLRTGDGNEIIRKSLVKIKKRLVSPKTMIS